MSEPKLCPYREISPWVPETDNETYFAYHSFGPCLQDKCAMWRDEKKHDSWDGKYTYPGWCGLAGKP